MEDRYKREVLLTGTDDYHDVFFANLGGAALGGLLLPVLGQWTVLVAAAEQAAVFVWMWIR